MWQVLIRINYRVDMKNPRYLFWLLAILYTNYLFAGFLPNELVHVGVGKLELHNMKIGDQIISYNGIEPATDFVTKINAKTCQTSIKIYLGDIILIVSPDQFFYLPVQLTWLSAQDLQINDQLLTVVGELVDVSQIEISTQKNIFYSLTVKKNHTYFVSKLGVLVHNEPLSISLIAATIGPKLAVAAGYAVKTVALGVFGYFCIKDLLKSGNSAKPVFPSCQSQLLFSGEQVINGQINMSTAMTESERENTQTLLFTQLATNQVEYLVQSKNNIVNNTAEVKPGIEIEASIEDSDALSVAAPDIGKDGEAHEVSEQIASDKPAQVEQAGEEACKTEENVESKIQNENDDLVKNIIKKITDKAKKYKEKCSKIFIREDGDATEANEEFDKLPLTDIKLIDKGDSRTGTLPNGWQATVRDESTDKRPTLEIQRGPGKSRKIKIRYGDKQV